MGCSRGTVKKGACEVSDLPPKEVDKRIRQAGGGRKKYSEKWAKIDEQFLTVLQEHTAGDPMDERVIWTDLNHKEIQQLLGETYEVWVSKPIIKNYSKNMVIANAKPKKTHHETSSLPE